MFNRTCIAIALLMSALALLPISARVSAADEPLLVIVGIAFPASDIPLAALKDSFGGQSTTVAGKRIVPINHPLDSPTRVIFDKAILGLEPAAVGRFWVDRKIRAQGNPPTTASTPELAVRIVASLANSITYTHKALLNPKVKVITVDGKAATDPKYPVKR